MQVFHSPQIDGVKIPIDQIIYVIEDVDCLSDLVKERSLLHLEDGLAVERSSSNRETGLMDDDLLDFIRGKMDNEPMEIMKYEDELTLSHFLNVLDGVLECTGRMVIMSTNYPERLDKALIPPGRMDIHVHFECATSEDAMCIIQNFHHQLDDDKNVKVDDKKFTPAHITQCCMNSNSFETVIEKLSQ